MLDNLHTIPWSKLQQCYGDAAEVPDLIERLTSRSATKRRDALEGLWSLIWHQGSVYEATAFAIPFLCELVREPDVRGRLEILQRIHIIAVDHVSETKVDPIRRQRPERNYPDLIEALENQRLSRQACNHAIAEEVETFLSLLSDPSPQ